MNKGVLALASAAILGTVLTGCQHRSGDRSFRTDPAYAQQGAPPTNGFPASGAISVPGDPVPANTTPATAPQTMPALPSSGTIPNANTNNWSATPGVNTGPGTPTTPYVNPQHKPMPTNTNTSMNTTPNSSVPNFTMPTPPASTTSP